MEHTWILYIIAFLLGIMVNELIRHFQKSYGTLKIDQSNPEKDVFRLDIDDIDNLPKKKFVVLKVDNHADLSQK